MVRERGAVAFDRPLQTKENKSVQINEHKCNNDELKNKLSVNGASPCA
jgi:hypothetical protein